MLQSLQDALYNWLSIKVVTEARPDDLAAQETEKMFYDMLINDFQLSNIEWEKDEMMYYVYFDQQNERKKQQFPRELIEIMIDQIEQQPDKYKNYPDS